MLLKIFAQIFGYVVLVVLICTNKHKQLETNVNKANGNSKRRNTQKES